ncbi:3',5'-cyclic AMP phosphodiesterase CpdA [Afipia massiliensis]|uniref:3',5'-cyclic AMP phosphodiesterase CpdA n=1 Tax=Afipia massiliensis TaxID=211460 RepID=A0A840MYZ8_9BRAD|nr:metallophosphoesterase [Afipia massiliensis]MBB5051427.1 3',5'-cyclic AMP phosphodiesterase CpdA [Afipia massiliensis]
MSSFRLTQITDTHLGARFPEFVENFHRVSQHIDDNRPDLIINSGDVAFDGPDHPDDLDFARALHDVLPVDCRYLPGNHDIGDNPTLIGMQPTQRVSEANRQNFITVFGEDRWQFDAAGWCFIGLNSLVMNTSLACEAEQREWLAEQLSAAQGKPVALFIHKPLYKDAPDDAETAATSFRYVPMPARSDLVHMFDGVNLQLVACGHVHQRRDTTFRNVRHIWAPSSSFVIRSNAKQELIGVKEVGLVEYVFQPDGFEVRHVRAAGQINIDLFSVLEPSTAA